MGSVGLRALLWPRMDWPTGYSGPAVWGKQAWTCRASVGILGLSSQLGTAGSDHVSLKACSKGQQGTGCWPQNSLQGWGGALLMHELGIPPQIVQHSHEYFCDRGVSGTSKAQLPGSHSKAPGGRIRLTLARDTPLRTVRSSPRQPHSDKMAKRATVLRPLRQLAYQVLPVWQHCGTVSARCPRTDPRPVIHDEGPCRSWAVHIQAHALPLRTQFPSLSQSSGSTHWPTLPRGPRRCSPVPSSAHHSQHSKGLRQVLTRATTMHHGGVSGARGEQRQRRSWSRPSAQHWHGLSGQPEAAAMQHRRPRGPLPGPGESLRLKLPSKACPQRSPGPAQLLLLHAERGQT